MGLSMTITLFIWLFIHYIWKGSLATFYVKCWKMKVVHDSNRRIGAVMKDHHITWYCPAAIGKSSRLHFPCYMLSEIEYYTCGAVLWPVLGSVYRTFCPPLPHQRTISCGTVTYWHDYQFLTSWSLRPILYEPLIPMPDRSPLKTKSENRCNLDMNTVLTGPMQY